MSKTTYTHNNYRIVHNMTKCMSPSLDYDRLSILA